jgi:hypothetical protein
MRLPDDVQESVVFLGRWKFDESGMRCFDTEGTGFLVESESKSLSGFAMTYLVTAKHVLDVLEPDVVVRFNKKDGSADYVEITDASWFVHPTDKSVDVALLPWAPPQTAKFKVITRDVTFLTKENINSKGIGTGDETFAVGLFYPVIGQKANRPIVRTGHMAMSPPEHVPVDKWVTPTMEGFLVEMRSLGGLSGSPVFVQRSIEVMPTEGTGRRPLAGGAIFLLGLMYGHWSVPKNTVDYPGDEDAADMLSAGIAIVVPAIKIAEVIDQPKLTNLLRERETAAIQRYPAIADGNSPQGVRPGTHEKLKAAVSAVPTQYTSRRPVTKKDRVGKGTEPPTTDENPQHKEDFNRLLGEAVKGPKSDEKT